ncbi:hypothetical protein SGLAM104S_08126 [Streptomyces glaucescens]
MMLELSSRPASARVRMPLTAIEPNRTMPAPPRTGMGTRETTAPSTGKAPRTSRVAPATATT